MEKTAYFSKPTISNTSCNMQNKLHSLDLQRSGLNFVPNKSALLVLDLQKYFFSPTSHAFIPSAPAIIPNILYLIDYFSGIKRPIFFTKHINDRENAGMMAIWWKDLLLQDSDLSNFIEEVNIDKGVVIKKERYDAFWKTSLCESLKLERVEQVVICGVMTHLCCETTARSAFVQDFQVYFTIDGTATYNEHLHFASLSTLSHGFAKVLLCRDLVPGSDL